MKQLCDYLWQNSPVYKRHCRSRHKGTFWKSNKRAVKVVATIWLTLMKDKPLVCTECFCYKENMIFWGDSILCHKPENFHLRKSISLLCVIPIFTNKKEHFLTQLNVPATKSHVHNSMHCMLPIHQKICPSSMWITFREQNLFSV